MKKSLLVTLADRNFINPAKQLFSGVYHNSGWEGDYMLLAYGIPDEELKWFIDKGILITQCRPVPYAEDFKDTRYSPVFFSKFQLFTPEFKKCRNSKIPSGVCRYLLLTVLLTVDLCLSTK